LALAGHVMRTFLSGSVNSSKQVTVEGTDLTENYSPVVDVDTLEVNIYICEGASCTPGSVTISSVTVSGPGSDPF